MQRRQTQSVASPRSRQTTCRNSPATTAQGNKRAAADDRGSTASAPLWSATPVGLKLAVAYARVSTDRQEQQDTIASQVDALQRAALQSGYALPAEFLFIDDGYSGASLDRPALDRLRDLVHEGAIEVVLVTAPDRLARHYAYQVVVLEEFTRAGCEVRFLNLPLWAESRGADAAADPRGLRRV
jgi:resolvase-like protein